MLVVDLAASAPGFKALMDSCGTLSLVFLLILQHLRISSPLTCGGPMGAVAEVVRCSEGDSRDPNEGSEARLPPLGGEESPKDGEESPSDAGGGGGSGDATNCRCAGTAGCEMSAAAASVAAANAPVAGSW